jgi:hypothetical protein
MRKLSDSLTDKLIGLPETGMGYQIVEATYKDYSHRDALVLNGSLIEPIVGNVQLMMKSLLAEDVVYAAKYASVSSDIIDVNLRSLPSMFKSSMYIEAKSANSATTSYTNGVEEFIRFSAFLNDKRITKDKGLVPGTFATTFEDAKYCLDRQIDPVARYALPSTKAVKYAFQIEPPARIEVKRGIVQPANDQPGGGDEVEFINGSPANTVTQIHDLTVSAKL